MTLCGIESNYYIFNDKDEKEFQYFVDERVQNEVIENSAEVLKCLIRNKTVVEVQVVNDEKSDNEVKEEKSDGDVCCIQIHIFSYISDTVSTFKNLFIILIKMLMDNFVYLQL